MNALFLDTSGWYAALASRDKHHASASAVYAAALRTGEQPVTTSFVVAETHALLINRTGHAVARRFLESVFAQGALRVEYPDEETVRSAVDRWVHVFQDQPFSLCDAVSFEVMRRERMSRVLAVDRHFRTAGFDLAI